MKQSPNELSRSYKNALKNHLKGGGGLDSAPGLGSRALKAGLQTLDLAKLHEKTLVNELLSGIRESRKASMIRRAGIFFAAAITPIEKTHRTTREAATQQKKFIETLSRRTVELAATNSELNREIIRRKLVEKALKSSERHYRLLLAQSNGLQIQLRQLSRQILSAQEDERRRISRELHDVVAQTLTGINIRLANLKKEAAQNTKGIGHNIDLTQQLVEKSVEIVHRFARELRPAVLDDLGLIPALHSFMKTFSVQTGVHARLTAFAGVEKLNTAWRTVFFRVAQEAFTNVARHANASRIDVTIAHSGGVTSMTIKDDGKSFPVGRVVKSNVNKRLGLLGMRERVEMAGGIFGVESSPGQGTTIQVAIPLAKTRKKTAGKKTKIGSP